jgi:hypothetical protein
MVSKLRSRQGPGGFLLFNLMLAFEPPFAFFEAGLVVCTSIGDGCFLEFLLGGCNIRSSRTFILAYVCFLSYRTHWDLRLAASLGCSLQEEKG